MLLKNLLIGFTLVTRDPLLNTSTRVGRGLEDGGVVSPSRTTWRSGGWRWRVDGGWWMVDGGGWRGRGRTQTNSVIHFASPFRILFPNPIHVVRFTVIVVINQRYILFVNDESEFSKCTSYLYDTSYERLSSLFIIKIRCPTRSSIIFCFLSFIFVSSLSFSFFFLPRITRYE